MKFSIALTPSPTVFATLLYAGNLMHGMRRAAELGYDGVELNLRDPKSEDVESVLAAARTHGLEIVSLGTGQAYLQDGLSVASADPDVRARCVERLQSHVDLAARVSAQVVIGGIRGRFDSTGEKRRIQYEGAIQAVRQVADYAASKQVVMTLEPINRYESDFVNNVDDGLAFPEDVQRSAVKLVLDTFHMNIEEASITAAFERAGDRLGHVHLVDSNRRAPSMGHIDFESILTTLCHMGYKGFLSGEFLPLPDDDTAAERNIAYLRQTMGKVL
jgi:5-keto-L-gluconate epimerase